MYIVKGKTRVVIVIPQWGIVLKIAIIRIWSTARLVISWLEEPKKSRDLFRIEMREARWWSWASSIKRPLFAGLMENWNEYGFYRRTKLKILQPTIFSIGVLNIQKYAPKSNLRSVGFWKQMVDTVGEKRIGFDHHHFSNAANFSVINDKLVILDYGNPRTYKVLYRIGDKLWSQFDVFKASSAR